MLVLGKGYHVAKSATVPTTVDTDDELVAANSKLSLLSGIAGAAAVIPGACSCWLGGPPWVCGLAAVTFGAATVVGLKLPSAVVATEPATRPNGPSCAAGHPPRRLGHGPHAGLVGFLTFLIAFTLRGTQERPYRRGVRLARVGSATRDLLGAGHRGLDRVAPTWHFGGGGGHGRCIGAPIGRSSRPDCAAPWPRSASSSARSPGGRGHRGRRRDLRGLRSGDRRVQRQHRGRDRAKVAFDSILQRDAPDANRGRSFARFETRFQLIWVVGAAIPVVIPIPGRLGYLMVAERPPSPPAPTC
jgi:hypothetical protein